jgi:hypothetical protein
LVLLEEATEAVVRVQDTGLPLDRPPPSQFIGNRDGNRGAQRKRVRLLAEVSKVDIDKERSLTLLEIDCEGTVFGQRRRPENAIGGKARIIRMDLFRGVNLTLVQVKSEEQEPSRKKPAVHAPVKALHETQICVEHERGCFAGIGIGSRTGALDTGLADEAIEIGDQRGIIAVGRSRVCGAR